MDVSDLKGLFVEVKKRMDGHIEHVRRELGGVRTGRASVNILDTVHVEAYGSMVPLNQVASLSVPEPAMIIAQPFDPSQMGNVEKGIRAANLGLNPTNDGKVIRIPIPALTEERRKELIRLVHERAESGRVAVRNVRRHHKDELEKLEREHTISEDELRRAEKELQKLTDQYVAEVDQVLATKEKELSEV
jgi:ribosome recycling factor